MGQQTFDPTPQKLVLAANQTGSFVPNSIARTPFVSFHLTKLSDKNDLVRLQLFTSNVDMQGQVTDSGVGVIRYPSGSANEYLWSADPSFEAANSGTLTTAPFSTGSAVGSVTYDVSGLNAKWGRLTISSKSGGTFQLVTVGKD